MVPTQRVPQKSQQRFRSWQPPSRSNGKEWMFSQRSSKNRQRKSKSERAARDEEASGQSRGEQTLAVVYHNDGIMVSA